VVKECFANGRLAPGGGDDTPGVRTAARAAADLGIPIDQLAIAAAVSQPWSPRVLSGAVTVSQVASHVAGAGLRLPEETLAAVADIAEPATDYWTARAGRPWA